MSAFHRIQPMTVRWRHVVAASLLLIVVILGLSHVLSRTALLVYTDPPGAYIILNNRVYGRSPLALTGLPPGKHRLAVVHRGYESHSQLLHLEQGTVNRLDVDLATGYGCAYIETLPLSANVYAGEEWLGQTPFLACELVASRETYLVSKTGYASEVVEMSVWANTTSRLRVVLKAGEMGRFRFIGTELGLNADAVSWADGWDGFSHLPMGVWGVQVDLGDDTTIGTFIRISGYQEPSGVDSDLSVWELGSDWMMRSFTLPHQGTPAGWGAQQLLVDAAESPYYLDATTLAILEPLEPFVAIWGHQPRVVVATGEGLRDQAGHWTLPGSDWHWGGWREERGLAFRPEQMVVVNHPNGRTQPLATSGLQIVGAGRGAAAAVDFDGLWALDEQWQWQLVSPKTDWEWVGECEEGGLLWTSGSLALVNRQGQLLELVAAAHRVTSASRHSGQLAYVELIDGQWRLHLMGQWQWEGFSNTGGQPVVTWAPDGEKLVFYNGDHRIWLWERW